MKNIVHNCDCMDFMAGLPDKAFGLAIVDVNYGIKVGGNKAFGKVGGNNLIEATIYKTFDDSKSPDKDYFDKLIKISKNQIIWGANHFISKIPYDSSCWIVWDKDNTGNFADCELAWTSFKTAVRKFRYRWNGLFQENMKNKEKRIHPTQKPVALYKWLLQNYAQPGWTIFDSHVGSGSIRIACYDMGFDFMGCEIDLDYWRDQEKRYQNHIANLELFDTKEIQDLIYDL